MSPIVALIVAWGALSVVTALVVGRALGEQRRAYRRRADRLEWQLGRSLTVAERLSLYE